MSPDQREGRSDQRERSDQPKFDAVSSAGTRVTCLPSFLDMLEHNNAFNVLIGQLAGLMAPR